MWPFSKSQSIAESGILCEMTDCHSHILPGVDDGVKTMDESLQVLAEIKRQGVRKVWLTPHIMEDIPNTTAGLKERFQELKEKFRKPEDAYCGTVELNLAAEYMMDNLLRSVWRPTIYFYSAKATGSICWWKRPVSIRP